MWPPGLMDWGDQTSWAAGGWVNLSPHSITILQNHNSRYDRYITCMCYIQHSSHYFVYSSSIKDLMGHVSKQHIFFAHYPTVHFNKFHLQFVSDHLQFFSVLIFAVLSSFLGWCKISSPWCGLYKRQLHRQTEAPPCKKSLCVSTWSIFNQCWPANAASWFWIFLHCTSGLV